MRWAIIQIPSMAIDGPSMPIGKVAMGPSMGLNGVSVRGDEGCIIDRYADTGKNGFEKSLLCLFLCQNI